MMGAALVTLTGLALAAACGGRNLEADDDDRNIGGMAQTSGNNGAGGTMTGAGGAGGAGGEGEGGQGGEPAPPPNPIDCISCVAENCPATLQCLQDPTCVQGIGCAVSMCLSGGSPDLLCFAECFDGDTGKAYTAFQAITCVFDKCGDQCGADDLSFP